MLGFTVITRKNIYITPNYNTPIKTGRERKLLLISEKPYGLPIKVPGKGNSSSQRGQSVVMTAWDSQLQK